MKGHKHNGERSREHRASGGRLPGQKEASTNNDQKEDAEGWGADDATPKDKYAGANSKVVKEAEKRKCGGRMKKKDGGKVEGEKAMKRLDRAPRKSGGRVGAEIRPLSMAAKTSERPGGKLDREDD